MLLIISLLIGNWLAGFRSLEEPERFNHSGLNVASELRNIIHAYDIAPSGEFIVTCNAANMKKKTANFVCSVISQ